MIGDVIESYGEERADPPNYDLVRDWVRDHIGTLQDEGYHVICVVEDLYLNYYPVRNNKTGRVERKPQVKVFETLVRVQSHIWAAARDMKCQVEVITPYEAMHVLTGITDVKTKREIRKAHMVKCASEMLGTTVSDHVADALGIGLAFLKKQADPV